MIAASDAPMPPPEPPPMLTLSLPSVALATVQPPSTGPMTSSSGTRTSLKNTSLNYRPAGRHLQRPHLDALGMHVDHHHRDPVVLGRVGIGADRGQSVAGDVRAAGPHLLSVDEPTAVDPGAARGDARCVGPGIGLTEQLTPDHLLGQCRTDPARDLLRGGVLDQGEDHPAGDPRTADAGRLRRRTPAR